MMAWVQRITDSYRRTGQYDASEEWYARVVQFQDIDPVNYYYYAKALSTNKKHEQAAEWFKRYAEASSKDKRAKELNKIVDIMQKNPELVIEVGSHTDSRGSDAYNQALSDRRAKSSVQYIMEKGIQSYRVYGKGYGETQLTNECEDGVICDERKHQMNRRTEFKVVRGSVKN